MPDMEHEFSIVLRIDPFQRVEYLEMPAFRRDRPSIPHLSALLGYVLPFAHIVAPLLIWVHKRTTIPGVDDAGRESLNFQLTVSLFGLVGIMLSAVFVGLVLIFALVVFHFCATVVAALHAQRGEVYRYPLALRIIAPERRDL